MNQSGPVFTESLFVSLSFHDAGDGVIQTPVPVTISTILISLRILMDIVALFDTARNEPRNLYDLRHLTDNRLVGLSDLPHAVASKVEFRNRTMTDAKEIFP
ncbi:MAG: hypothetical protein K0B01_12815 [Syntrophobacterales bacterium]|nr:hypothetical protein [Syntrophobacterales bacterium]